MRGEAFARAILSAWIASEGEKRILSRIPLREYEFYRDPRLEDGDKYLPQLVGIEPDPPRLIYSCSSIWLDGSGEKTAYAQHYPPTITIKAPVWDFAERDPDVSIYASFTNYLGHSFAVQREWAAAYNAFRTKLTTGEAVATGRIGSPLADRTRIPPEAWGQIEIIDWTLSTGRAVDGTILYALQADDTSDRENQGADVKARGRPSKQRDVTVSYLDELYPEDVPSEKYEAVWVEVRQKWTHPSPPPSLETVKRALEILRTQRNRSHAE